MYEQAFESNGFEKKFDGYKPVGKKSFESLANGHYNAETLFTIVLKRLVEKANNEKGSTYSLSYPFNFANNGLCFKQHVYNRYDGLQFDDTHEEYSTQNKVIIPAYFNPTTGSDYYGENGHWIVYLVEMNHETNQVEINGWNPLGSYNDETKTLIDDCGYEMFKKLKSILQKHGNTYSLLQKHSAPLQIVEKPEHSAILVLCAATAFITNNEPNDCDSSSFKGFAELFKVNLFAESVDEVRWLEHSTIQTVATCSPSNRITFNLV